MIQYDFTNDEIPAFDPEFFVLVLPQLISDEKKEVGEISIIFTNDEHLLSINQDYLKHDYFTDIITFDYSHDQYISGDLFISLERVGENAKQFEKDFFNELCRVVFHGVLHLCAYNDKTESEIAIMRSKEEFYIDNFVSRETK
jgi:probable rRNA maturation factor